ncbi:MAG: c-type cytochrome [Steroidobacteraceae bacterium]
MDGLLMRRLAVNSLFIAAIALAATVARDAAAADVVVPHDPSAWDATTLISNACSKCHGAAGVSISPLFPILAGQQGSYIETELKLFRQRGRSDPLARAFMWGIARGLTDDQIEGVAQYFASQPPVRGTSSSNPALAEKGKLIYENGVPARGVIACMTCHGPKAEGDGNNAFPRLAGQHRDYLVTELQQFRGLLRENAVMQGVAANITDDEIASVAEYLASK